MPTYDYECADCGHKFEKFQSITAQPIKECPACGKKTAKRLIGIGAGVIFKGGGFYETDYRSDSYSKDAKKESGGGETKSDAKKGEKAEKGAAAKSDAPKPASDKPAAASKSESKSPSKPAGDK